MSQAALLFEWKEINKVRIERRGKSGRRVKEYSWKCKKRKGNLKMVEKKFLFLCKDRKTVLKRAEGEKREYSFVLLKVCCKNVFPCS